MSFLYTISNICVPYSLIVFDTLKRNQSGQAPSYGKWMILIVLTFAFNLLVIFNSWFITFIDLLLKIGIYFLPCNMNDIVEERVRNLHLEGIIQSYRCQFINRFFDYFSKGTNVLLNQLREEESDQFRDALINSLSNKNDETKLKIAPTIKSVRNTQAQCTIITDKSIQQAKTLFDKKLRLVEKQKEELERNKVELEKKSNSKRKYEAEKQVPQKQKPTSNKYQINKKMLQTMPVGDLKQKKPEKEQKTEKVLGSSNSIQNLNQSSQFLPQDLESEQEQDNPIVSKLRYSRKNEEKPTEIKQERKKPKEESVLRRSNTTVENLKMSSSNVASRERSYSPDSSSIREQAQILDKLDLSVSEYSGMFDEEEIEDDNEDSRKLVCKVEAIVEIGSAPSARLQIYNLQLYSNRDLRIVSLYNREFEKHKLVSMVKGVNNYYELNLSGSSISKRKIKFRGQHQAFLKYL